MPEVWVSLWMVDDAALLSVNGLPVTPFPGCYQHVTCPWRLPAILVQDQQHQRRSNQLNDLWILSAIAEAVRKLASRVVPVLLVILP